MQPYKSVIVRTCVFVLLVFGWGYLHRVSLFSPEPKVLSVQDGQLPDTSEQYGFVPAERVRELSPTSEGLFLYANDEARFYPFAVLAQTIAKADSIGGVEYEVSGTDRSSARVAFPSEKVVPYEVTLFSEAQHAFPGLFVYVGEK